MRTEYTLLQTIYNAIVSVKSSLDGGEIYLKKRPVNSDKVDVVIGNLPILEGDTLDMVAFINIYANNLESSGLPEYVLLDKITTEIINLINNYSQGSTFISLEIISQGILNDNENKNTSYSSIRLQCYIEDVD